jgi:hypothetical protein
MERLRRHVQDPQVAHEEPPQLADRTPTSPPESPPDPTQALDVQVISGASVQTFRLAGLQVAHARAVLSTILQIDPRAHVLVNGRPVRSTYRLVGGDVLELVHQAGEKGGAHGHPPGDRGTACGL